MDGLSEEVERRRVELRERRGGGYRMAFRALEAGEEAAAWFVCDIVRERDGAMLATGQGREREAAARAALRSLDGEDPA